MHANDRLDQMIDDDDVYFDCEAPRLVKMSISRKHGLLLSVSAKMRNVQESAGK